MINKHNKSLTFDGLSLEDIAIKKLIPLNVQIDLTNECDANCIFCFQGNDHTKRINELSLSQIKMLLNDLKEMGTLRIGFSGGEPLLRKDIIDILEYSKLLGYEVTMVSNGNLLNNDLVQALADLKLNVINFSVHSLTQKNNSFHFGTNKPDYELKLQYISDLNKLSSNVGISVTVTKYNIDELPNILYTLKELGIDENKISFNSLLPGKKNIENLKPTQQQLDSIFKHNPELLHNFTYKHNGNRSFLCAAARSTVNISYNGDVFPCSFIGISGGNLHENSIKHIWKRSKLFNIIRSFKKQHFEKCFKCDYNKSCSMCFAKNLEDTGDLYTPSPSFCKLTYKTNEAIKNNVI